MARTAEVDELPDGLVAEVEAAVRAGGALPLARLTRVKLTRRAQGLLHEALARRGLERTGKAARVPLREQVSRAIEAGPVAMAALRKAMRGGAAAELKVALADLARAGRVLVVMRRGVEHVAPPGAGALARDEVAAVADAARALAKAVASVRPRAGRPARTLWRADVLEVLDRARAAIAGAHARAADGRADPVARVVAEVRRQASGVTGLAPVPAVARALGGEVRDVGEALLAAARAGLIELRPESGVGLLAPADAALCPTGADGWPLSWARAREGAA